LCGFLAIDAIAFDPGARVNASLSPAKTKILRIINHFTHNSYRPSHLISERISTSGAAALLARLPALNDQGSGLDAGSREAIAAYYHESNRRLERDADIVLTRDYP
jgi:hypothetical protein